MFQPLVAVSTDVKHFDNYDWHAVPKQYLEAAIAGAGVFEIFLAVFFDAWCRLFGRGATAAIERSTRHKGLRCLAVGILVGEFEQWIGLQQAFQFLVQLLARQLQQADRLLQLRRQCQVLRKFEL